MSMSSRHSNTWRGPLGKQQRGVAKAATRSEAYRQLMASGMTPLTIRPAREKKTGLFSGSKVRSKDIAHFTYQFSVLMAAKIPIGEGLQNIADNEKNPKLKEIIADIAFRIEAGEQIANAIAAHKKVFGDLYIETIRAAEKTGNLVKVLEHLAEMLERQQEMRQAIRGAMMYPACVMSVLTLAVTFLIAVVIEVREMFGQRISCRSSRGSDGARESMQNYWWVYLLTIVLAVYSVRTWRRPAGRKASTAAQSTFRTRSRSWRCAGSRGVRAGALVGLGLLEAIEMSGTPDAPHDGCAG
jgi:type II secretory pathway component PulF